MKEKPLYFYHLVNKDANINDGLLSLQYLYDNKMYDLFDKYADKYKDRITNGWNIKEYAGKTNLTREEIIDALNIFRGENAASYIYFFKYFPYKELGKRMEEILKYKDIYRININDEEIKTKIKDIFYGYDMSNSDNKVLNKSYYENISKGEYFSKYKDDSPMNYATLNHIGIIFEGDKCECKYLEKVNTNFEDINTTKELLTYMDEFINYGFVANNKVYKPDSIDFQENFRAKWKLSINDELIYKKYGNCFDQVELERYYFDSKKIENKTYFIYFELPYENNYNMHTFLIYKENEKYYIFENADSLDKGLHEFNTLDEALEYKKELFINEEKVEDEEIISKLKIYDYNKPTKNMNIDEFIDFILD